MSNLNIRELAGGLSLTALGAVAAVYAASNYSIGSVTRMGPGMVPMVLGVILGAFGLVLMLQAFWVAPARGHIRVFIPAVILASIVAFAALITPFGLMPAVFALVVISSYAEQTVRPLTTLILAVSLCFTAWLIFVVALQLPLTLFNWPF